MARFFPDVSPDEPRSGESSSKNIRVGGTWRLLCELAAIAEKDPERYTLRELSWMAEARDRYAWNRTFAVLAQLYNVNREQGDEPIQPMKFFPWADGEPAAKPPTPEQEKMLEEIFPTSSHVPLTPDS